MSNGTPPYHAQQRWVDQPPCDAIIREANPNPGMRHADGSIECGGCGLVQPDNSAPGLKPSCNMCWTAIDVVATSQHRFAFPPNYSLFG